MHLFGHVQLLIENATRNVEQSVRFRRAVIKAGDNRALSHLMSLSIRELCN